MANRNLKEELAKAGKTDVRNTQLTLEALLKMYEDGLGKFDERTRANRRSILKTFRATWKHGLEAPVADVTPAQLEVWLAIHKKRMHRASINAYILFLRQLFNLAVSHRAIAESPAAGFKMLKPEDPIRLTPTWAQFQRLLKSIRSQKLNADCEDSADLIEFMGLAGIGTAECASLRGEHIDFENKKIQLYRSKTDTGFTIPIFPQVMPFLEKLNQKGQIKNSRPVFKIKDPKKALDGACKRLKFPHFSPRSLRRCFITRAVELGIDFKTIAAWQGHQDGGVLIAKTYSHLRNDHSDAMAQRLRSL